MDFKRVVELFIRPPRDLYNSEQLGISGVGGFIFKDRKRYLRHDITLTNPRGHRLRCTHYLPYPLRSSSPGGDAAADAPPPPPAASSSSSSSSRPSSGGDERDDAETLDALLLSGKIPTAPCVVYLHGNCGSRLDSFDIIDLVFANQCSLFTFDFAGSGLSDGEFVSLGYHEVADLVSVLDHLSSLPYVGPLALWGRSMGAVTAVRTVALRLPCTQNVRCMVLDSPFSSLKELAHVVALQNGNKVPKKLLTGVAHLGLKVLSTTIQRKAQFSISDVEASQSAEQCVIPALFIHALDDYFVPQLHTLRVYQKYAGPKEFIIVPGNHNSLRTGGGIAMASDFIADHIRDFFPSSFRTPNLWGNSPLTKDAHCFLVKMLNNTHPLYANCILVVSVRGVDILSPFTETVLYQYPLDRIKRFGHRRGNFIIRFHPPRVTADQATPPPTTPPPTTTTIAAAATSAASSTLAKNKLISAFSTPSALDIVAALERVIQLSKLNSLSSTRFQEMLESIEKLTRQEPVAEEVATLAPAAANAKRSEFCSQERILGGIIVSIDHATPKDLAFSRTITTIFADEDSTVSDDDGSPKAEPELPQRDFSPDDEPGLSSSLRPLASPLPSPHTSRSRFKSMPFSTLQSECEALLQREKDKSRIEVAVFKGTFSFVYNQEALALGQKAVDCTGEVLHRIDQLVARDGISMDAELVEKLNLARELSTRHSSCGDLSVLEFSIEHGHGKSPVLAAKLASALRYVLDFLAGLQPVSELPPFPDDLKEEAAKLVSPSALSNKPSATLLEACVFKGSFSLVYNKEAIRLSELSIRVLRAFLSFYRPRKSLLEQQPDIEPVLRQIEAICQPIQAGNTQFELLVGHGDPSAQETAQQISQAIVFLLDRLPPSPAQPQHLKSDDDDDDNNDDSSDPSSSSPSSSPSAGHHSSSAGHHSSSPSSSSSSSSSSSPPRSSAAAPPSSSASSQSRPLSSLSSTASPSPTSQLLASSGKFEVRQSNLSLPSSFLYVTPNLETDLLETVGKILAPVFRTGTAQAFLQHAVFKGTFSLVYNSHALKIAGEALSCLRLLSSRFIGKTVPDELAAVLDACKSLCATETHVSPSLKAVPLTNFEKYILSGDPICHDYAKAVVAVLAVLLEASLSSCDLKFSAALAENGDIITSKSQASQNRTFLASAIDKGTFSIVYNTEALKISEEALKVLTYLVLYLRRHPSTPFSVLTSLAAAEGLCFSPQPRAWLDQIRSAVPAGLTKTVAELIAALLPVARELSYLPESFPCVELPTTASQVSPAPVQRLCVKSRSPEPDKEAQRKKTVRSKSPPTRSSDGCWTFGVRRKMASSSSSSSSSSSLAPSSPPSSSPHSLSPLSTSPPSLSPPSLSSLSCSPASLSPETSPPCSPPRTSSPPPAVPPSSDMMELARSLVQPTNAVAGQPGQRTFLESSIYRGSFSLVYNREAQKVARNAVHVLRTLTDYVQQVGDGNGELLDKANQYCTVVSGATELEQYVAAGDPRAHAKAKEMSELLARVIQLAQKNLSTPSVAYLEGGLSLSESALSSSSSSSSSSVPVPYDLTQVELRLLQEVADLVGVKLDESSFFEKTVMRGLPLASPHIDEALRAIRLAFSYNKHLHDALNRRGLLDAALDRVGLAYQLLLAAPAADRGRGQAVTRSLLEEAFCARSRDFAAKLKRARDCLLELAAILRQGQVLPRESREATQKKPWLFKKPLHS